MIVNNKTSSSDVDYVLKSVKKVENVSDDVPKEKLKVFNAFVMDITGWERSKYKKSGWKSYDINSMEFSDAANPSDKYMHHVQHFELMRVYYLDL